MNRKVIVLSALIGLASGPVKYIYWEEDGAWLGYLQDFPDYWTQGESLEDLQVHLSDLYADLSTGEVPGIRRIADLVIS